MDGATRVASHRWRQPGNRRWVHDDQNPKCDDRECERHIEVGPGGEELLGGDKDGDHGHPADAHHAQHHQHPISPMPEPTQQIPNASPEPAPSRQARRKRPPGGGPRGPPPRLRPHRRPRTRAAGYNPYTATPTNAHTARYDPTNNGTAHTRPLT